MSALGHTILDVAGMVPLVGEAADGINAIWYSAEGDYVNAALSAAATIPFLGTAAMFQPSGRVESPTTKKESCINNLERLVTQT